MKDLSSLGLRVEKNRILVLDQTRLPHEELWLESRTPEDMVALIKRLAVRGAPLIGVAAAAALARFVEQGADQAAYRAEALRLREARPTAVNLMAAVDRMLACKDPVREAERIFEEDVELCEAMARHGEKLIADGDNVLTHCNAGGLATAGIGTALGVIIRAHQSGKKIHVWVDETRPLLQGARLTAWELTRYGVPFTLIADNMAAHVMSLGKVQKIFTGADRIAANGDAANKIGTYGLAVAAKHHGVPFYIVAPYTTVDERCPTGRDIPIETRSPDEVRGERGTAGAPVYNPAFDVTPRSLITALVLDTGLR